MAIDDPADSLAWLTRRAELREQWRREAEAKKGPVPTDPAPAKDVRLTPDEQHWLECFLSSVHVPDTTLSLDGLDGFLTARVIRPEMVPPSEYLPQIWGAPAGEGPA